MLQPNALKRNLGDGRRKVGYWLTLVSPTATEIAAGAGFDWLLIDMEHATNELGDVLDHLRAAEGGTAEPVVRVPWNDPVIVKRVLDVGARSIMFPYVENAEEARLAVASTRYPPAGIRGVAGTSRATRYGRVPNYATTAAADICVIVQAETQTALGNIPAIAAVAGVDAIFIGPSDLAASMGFTGQPRAPEVRSVMLDGLKAIQQSGKVAATLNSNEEDARGLFDAGFEMVAVGSDAATLARETTRLAKHFGQVTQDV